MKRILNAIGNIIVTLVLVFAILVTVLVITSTKSEIGVPSLFGYAIMNVETDSMESEEGFFTGDLILLRMIEKEEANDLKVGDVITFWRYLANERYIETHRIIENIYENQYAYEVVDGIRIHNGKKCYVTKGDNTPGADFLAGGELDYATDNTIIGVWEGKSIPKLGAAIKFLRSQMGFMVCIVAPLALLFFYELYRFIVTMNEKKKETALAEVAASEEEIRQKAIAEYLEKQQAEQASADGASANREAEPAVSDDGKAAKEPQNPQNAADEKTPDAPDAPNTPDAPDAPNTPDTPDAPNTPDTPDAADEEAPAAEVPEDKTPTAETK
ncbi:MAG: signal peptidase I [Clostridiales bacterium]|nr:signal peptidase I [Clostridiales bacterium]